MKQGPTLVPLTPAHLTGLGAFQIAFVLALFDLRWAVLPLGLFLFLCLAAPFCPGVGFFLPIVSRGRKECGAVSLTFDDGPDPATTPRLLDLLSRHGARATFFVTGLRAGAHRSLIKDILSRGHSIGNHSFHHDPLLMLRSTVRLHEEVAATQTLLNEFGVRPLAFRPPVGITNPRLWPVLLAEGMYCLNFNRRAHDAGNRRTSGLSRKILKRVRPGDIVLLHDVAPRNDFNVAAWLDEIEAIITGLKQKNISILPLEDLTGRPVMMKSQSAASPGPVNAFYNTIAGSYENERCESMPYPAFARERELFAHNYLPLVSSGHRILEIGAGTGIYTLAIAKQCREITAVEPSENMIAILKAKAAREGISTIIYRNCGIEEFCTDEPYDSICAFSSFEYIPDLAHAVQMLSRILKPGGTIYFTTAHRSLFRFFTQIGNAMRQGVWLHARSARNVRRILASVGFSDVKVSTYLMKCLGCGGLILEAIAKKNHYGR